MTKPKDDDAKLCGIVMPISDCDGCPASHWADVLNIIRDAATSVGFSARLVSDTMESNLIHKEILANIYNDDIVIVDVSGRNPNVFFELGIRMATQKPTVIVKDDTTSYPFDTGPNRFIEYPRDLRHPQMEDFKRQLCESLRKTKEHGLENSFIGQLGPFQIPKVDAKEVALNEIVLSRLSAIERSINTITRLNPLGEKFNDSEGTRKRRFFEFYRTKDGSGELRIFGFDEYSVKNGVEDFLKKRPGSGIDLRIEHNKNFLSVYIQSKSSEIESVFRNLSEEIRIALPF